MKKRRSVYRLLRSVRIVASCVMFALFLWIFFRFGIDGEGVAKGEFVPLLMRGLGVSAASFGVLVLLLLGIGLFGRWYCSFCCPLGFLQDLAGRVGKTFRPKGYRPEKNRRTLRSLWGVSLFGLALGGVVLPLALFEPYTLFGRNLNLLRQLGITANNALGWQPLNESAPYHLYPALIAAAILAGVLLLALFRGRVFCNTLCPAGFLLGLFSRFARKSPAIDREHCIRCGNCVRACKAGCIDLEKQKIDSERCVDCFDCGTVCPVDAVAFGAPPSPTPPAEKSRRNFLLGLGVAGVGSLAAGGAIRAALKKRPLRNAMGVRPIAPPGAASLEEFTRRCTGCQLCAANCSGHVLRPALLEYGPAGIGQVHLDFRHGFCSFECAKCGQACPTGAITAVPLKEKQLRRIGTARKYLERCVVNTHRKNCGACAEHCPTGALTMEDIGGGLTLPVLNAKYCIGCGACEFICPAVPFKAMIVEGIERQEPAEKAPLAKNREEAPAAITDDFPF